MNKIRPTLVAFARGRTRIADPEDLVQEAFCRAVVAKIHSSLLESWMRTTIARLAVDVARRERPPFSPVVTADIECDPADDVIDRVCARALAQRAARLPSPQAEVIQRLSAGQTVRDIANVTGATVRAVENHLRRARLALRRTAAS